MIPKADYLSNAPEEGRQVAINHIACKAGRDTKGRLYIKRTHNAVLAYCHNCGDYGVTKTNRKIRNIDVLKSIVTADEIAETVTTDAMLPIDTTLDMADWPLEARYWVFTNQLTADSVTKYKIGYSPSLGRVVLPIFDNTGKLIFWQGRNIDGHGPKYINSPYVKKPVFTMDSMANKHVIITEDILSAIVVQQAYNAGEYTAGKIVSVALLGTTLPDDVTALLSDSLGIYIWLDNDVAGKLATKNIVEKLKLLYPITRIRYVVDEPEPKKYQGIDADVLTDINKRGHLLGT